MKSINNTYFFLFLIAQISFLNAQKIEYSVFSIPENLKENANSVVRMRQTNIEIESKKSMTIKTIRAVTVLNELGFHALNETFYYDKNTKIKTLEGEIYDPLGFRLTKIKQNNFKDTSVNDGYSVFNDNRILTLNYTPIDYPFTIVLESEIHTSNTAFIPMWLLIDNYFESVENINLSIKYHPELGFKWNEVNFTDSYLIEKTEDLNSIHYTAKNISAIKKEEASPTLSKLVPKIIFTLEKFHLEGVDGSSKDWIEFGKWYNDSLLKGTNELTEETKIKIQKLVENTPTSIEKAKLIYQYVQNKTRYVSIQVGIGGWKPMSAKDVDRLGYGDCKALVNYTKSLLSVVGLPSYFTLVYADADEKKDIQSEFVCMQGNHAILNLPIGSENYWLECTSQTSPFMYQNSSTDGRSVLVIKPNGGEIIKTKSYAVAENKKEITGEYTLSENGDITGKVRIVSTGLKYDDIYSIERLSSEKQMKYYKTHFGNLHELKINQLTYDNNKELFQFSEELELEAKRYGVANKNKLLVILNAFDQNDISFKKYRKRENDFEILRGSLSVDDITLHLPDDFKIEHMPTGNEVTTKYGVYKTEIVAVSEKTISYKRELTLNEGFYTNTEYDDFLFFLEQVTRNDASKIILTKK